MNVFFFFLLVFRLFWWRSRSERKESPANVFISIDSRLPQQNRRLFSPRFLLLRRIDVVHIGLKARKRRRRETELGREGLEPRRGCDRHRFFFLFLLSSIAKSVEKRASFFSSSSSSFRLFTNVTSPSSERGTPGQGVCSCGRRSAFCPPESPLVSRTESSRGPGRDASRGIRRKGNNSCDDDDADQFRRRCSSQHALFLPRRAAQQWQPPGRRRRR